MEIQVTCLVDRYWSPAAKAYKGTEEHGTLIDIITQSSEEDIDQMIPVGIVVLDDGTFQAVPVEFIKKTSSQL